MGSCMRISLNDRLESIDCHLHEAQLTNSVIIVFGNILIVFNLYNFSFRFNFSCCFLFERGGGGGQFFAGFYFCFFFYYFLYACISFSYFSTSI